MLMKPRLCGLILLLNFCCGQSFSEVLYLDGIYLSFANPANANGSQLVPLSSLLGQINYARRLSENRTVRLGLSFSLLVEELATTASYGLVAEDLEYLGSGPFRPYLGLGLQLGRSSSGSAQSSGSLWAVRIPFGFEYPITDYFSVGLEDNLASTSHIGQSWNLDRFTFGFGFPSVFFSFWFA